MEIPEPKPADLKPGTWLVWHFTTFRLSYLAGGDEFVPVNTRRAIDRDARKAIVKADLAMYRQFPKVPRGSFASRSLDEAVELAEGALAEPLALAEAANSAAERAGYSRRVIIEVIPASWLHTAAPVRRSTARLILSRLLDLRDVMLNCDLEQFRTR